MRIERNYWILDQEKPEYISNLCKPTRLLQCLQMYTWVMIFMIIWISFYPRPSEPLYCSIGQIYPSFAIELEYCVTGAEIHECVKKFSPFIPIALSCLSDQMNQFEESRQKKIACICSTEKSLDYALKSPIKIKY